MSAVRPQAGFKARLAAGDTLIGAFANLGSPLAVEALAIAGLDWVLVDLEHGGGHEAALMGQIHGSAAGGAALLVRVEVGERPRIQRALDLGADGVMIPRIDSAAQAAEAVAHTRFPPLGDRGVATYNRACAFGTRPQALDEAAERVVCVVQIESPEAVADAVAIAALDGVDALFIGPGDLSQAMGIRGRFDDPRFRDAVERVVGATRAAGKAAGILVPGPGGVAGALADGFRLLAVGSDSTLLVQAGAAVVAAAAEATA
jgi:2-keto-3-deoxy-L-rhamnonate aldolase RhmA